MQLPFKRAHSTAGVQREECMILFVSKRFISLSELIVFSTPLCLSLPVSRSLSLPSIASPTAASPLASLQMDD